MTKNEFSAWLEGYFEGTDKPGISVIKAKLVTVKETNYYPKIPTFPSYPRLDEWKPSYYTVT